jgi:hypothetical protein
MYKNNFVHKIKMYAYNPKNAEKLLEEWYVVGLTKSVEEYEHGSERIDGCAGVGAGVSVAAWQNFALRI